MGREIRRVPADWEHPKFTEGQVEHAWQRDAFHPLFDKEYNAACEEWYREAVAYVPGVCGTRWYHEYAGAPPDETYYRTREWTTEEATHYQVYETVSEGTPVTPHFATKRELVEYLVKNGDFWDQKRAAQGHISTAPWSRYAAESFVEVEWAPSLMTQSSGDAVVIHEPRDGAL